MISILIQWQLKNNVEHVECPFSNYVQDIVWFYNNINLYYYLIIYYLIDSNKITHNSATIQISRKNRGWDITTAMAYYDNSRLMIHCLTVAEFYRVYMQCFF